MVKSSDVNGAGQVSSSHPSSGPSSAMQGSDGTGQPGRLDGNKVQTVWVVPVLTKSSSLRPSSGALPSAQGSDGAGKPGRLDDNRVQLVWALHLCRRRACRCRRGQVPLRLPRAAMPRVNLYAWMATWNGGTAAAAGENKLVAANLATFFLYC